MNYKHWDYLYFAMGAAVTGGFMLYFAVGSINYALGYAAALHFLIAAYLYGVFVARNVPIADTEELHEEVAAWKEEAEKIWSHITDESPAERGSISSTLRTHILERDELTCGYCKGRGTKHADPDNRPWHIDHILPVSRGGQTIPGNLILACSSCNLSKHDATGAEFIRRRVQPVRRRRRERR